MNPYEGCPGRRRTRDRASETEIEKETYRTPESNIDVGQRSRGIPGDGEEVKGDLDWRSREGVGEGLVLCDDYMVDVTVHDRARRQNWAHNLERRADLQDDRERSRRALIPMSSGAMRGVQEPHA